MNATRTIAALSTLVALATAGPANAADDEQPTADQPKCSIVSVKKTFKTAWVNKNGIPVTVTCDRPAKLVVGFGFKKSKADYDWMMMHPGGIPGIAGGPPTDVPAGESVIKGKMIPKKFVLEYKKVPLFLNVGLQDPEHANWFRDIGMPKRVTLVR